LTAAEAAEILRTSPWVVVKLCREKALRASKPHKSWLIEPADLDAYIAAHTNDKAAS
jgi:excisionase family DNA binding protein